MLRYVHRDRRYVQLRYFYRNRSCFQLRYFHRDRCNFLLRYVYVDRSGFLLRYVHRNRRYVQLRHFYHNRRCILLRHFHRDRRCILLRHIHRDRSCFQLRHFHRDRRCILLRHFHRDRRYILLRYIYVDRSNFLLGYAHVNLRLQFGYVYRNFGRLLRYVYVDFVMLTRHVHVNRRQLLLRYVHVNLRLQLGNVYVNLRRLLTRHVYVYGSGFNRRQLHFYARCGRINTLHLFFIFFLRRLRPSQAEEEIYRHHRKRNRREDKRILIQIFNNGNRVVSTGRVGYERLNAAYEISEYDQRNRHKEHQHGSDSKVLDTRCFRTFDAIFGGAERVDNHKEQAKHGNRFKSYGNKTDDIRQNALCVAAVYCVCNAACHKMDTVMFQNDIANRKHRCNLQNIANKRHNSAVRSLNFSDTLFVVDVESAYFAAQEPADNMYT